MSMHEKTRRGTVVGHLLTKKSEKRRRATKGNSR